MVVFLELDDLDEDDLNDDLEEDVDDQVDDERDVLLPPFPPEDDKEEGGFPPQEGQYQTCEACLLSGRMRYLNPRPRLDSFWGLVSLSRLEPWVGKEKGKAREEERMASMLMPPLLFFWLLPGKGLYVGRKKVPPPRWDWS